MRVDPNSIASAFVSDEAIEALKKRRHDKRSRAYNSRKASKIGLGMFHLSAKANRRDQLLRTAGETPVPEHDGQFSETAQEIKMRKAAEKRARKSGQN